MNYTTSRIRLLFQNGVPLREIARRLSMTSTTVFRVVHGKELNSRPRCPICGAKLKTNRCRACELRQILADTKNVMPDLWAMEQSWDGTPIVIQLKLRPREYTRYLDVRRKKEQNEQYRFM